MQAINIAFATDDGKEFIDRHFGDALFYDVYTLCSKNICFVKRIANSTEEEEEGHADPKKAKGIAGLLQTEDVSIVVSRIFGPNIKRISKKFLCVIASQGAITDIKEYLHFHREDLLSEMEKDEKILKITL